MQSIFSVLPRAKVWALVLAIFFIIATVLGALCLLGFMLVFFQGMSFFSALFTTLLCALPWVMVLLFSIFLMKYQGACGRAAVSQNHDDLVLAALNQKRYIILQGILSLLILLLMVFGIMVAIAMPFFAGHH